MTRRRQHAGGPGTPTHRRRRRSRAGLTALSAVASEQRLRLPAHSRAYAAGLVVLGLAVAYLYLGAQATSQSYELARLQTQQTRLLADQDQLRYQTAALHTPARIEQAAASSGLQRRPAPTSYLAYQAAGIDVGAPVGQGRPDTAPGWQRAVLAVASAVGLTRDALAAGR